MRTNTVNVWTRWTLKQLPKPSWCWNGKIAGFLLSLLFFVPFATAQVALKVEWKEERLSVFAERAPLSQVLQEVAKQTGVKFRGLDVPQENVSLHFSHLPLLEGLRRLLAQVNYVIIEERSSQGAMLPAQAVILGRLAPLTSEKTTPSAEAEQIEEEQTVVEVSPDQDGVPLEDEQTATMGSPGRGGVPVQGSVPLEEEQAAVMMNPDQGGAPLEEEQTATMVNPNQGGVPLEDERNAVMMRPDQGGVPLEDERTAPGG